MDAVLCNEMPAQGERRKSSRKYTVFGIGAEENSTSQITESEENNLTVRTYYSLDIYQVYSRKNAGAVVGLNMFYGDYPFEAISNTYDGYGRWHPHLSNS